jgi:DNA-directed RNA polymerase specialized sigma subunit
MHRTSYKPNRDSFSFQRKTAVPRGREATINRIVEVLSGELGRVPTDREVAAILAISLEGVQRIRSSKKGGNA